MNRFMLLSYLAAALSALTSLAQAAGHIDSDTLVVTPLGQFNNVDYVQYEAMFEGVTSGGHYYRVPCHITAPDLSENSSGVVLYDWLNNSLINNYGSLGFQLPLGRFMLTDELLFNSGHLYATVRSNRKALGTPWLFSGFDASSESIASPLDEFEIVSDFVRGLSSDPVAGLLAGPIERKVAIAFSNGASSLRGIVRQPIGQGLFDLSMTGGIGAYTIFPAGATIEAALQPTPPPIGAVREININTEAEAMNPNWGVSLMRYNTSNYRSYEIAGAAHGPATADALAIYELFKVPDLDSINPLDWTPFVRSLFVAGLEWCDGTEPPPAIWLGRPGDDFLTRDAKGNALIRYVGGAPLDTTAYRHPEVAVGLGQYLAVYESDVHYREIAGGFVDLSDTFESHAAYVEAIADHALMLVGQRYLLPEDAAEIILRAENSDVGNP